MRKRPLLLVASFFLAGISYSAVKDIRIFVLLPFCICYLMIPKIKEFGWKKKEIQKAIICFGGMVLVCVAGMIHMKSDVPKTFSGPM